MPFLQHLLLVFFCVHFSKVTQKICFLIWWQARILSCQSFSVNLHSYFLKFRPEQPSWWAYFIYCNSISVYCRNKMWSLISMQWKRRIVKSSSVALYVLYRLNLLVKVKLGCMCPTVWMSQLLLFHTLLIVLNCSLEAEKVDFPVLAYEHVKCRRC